MAQDTEAAFPECVTQMEGFIDGEKVTDLRVLDQSPLLFALINAVKELKTMNDQLTARVAQLEQG